jgi:hypothetical protein
MDKRISLEQLETTRHVEKLKIQGNSKENHQITIRDETIY